MPSVFLPLDADDEIDGAAEATDPDFPEDGPERQDGPTAG